MERLFPHEIDRAVEYLRRSLPVAFPTETVYGLGARLSDPTGIQAIFRTKGRPSDNPLICHLASMDDLERLASDIPPEARLLARHFWPGPLTLVLKKHPSVPSLVTGELETVAVRMPRHPLAQQLLQKIGEPLAAPSANRSGRPSSTCADHVLDDFEGMPGAVLDGGVTEEGVESTVLALLTPPGASSNTPTAVQASLLRPGALSVEMITTVLQCPVHTGEGLAHASPGTRYRHYAPRAPLLFHSRLEEPPPPSSKKRFLMSTEPHEGVHLLTPATLYALLRQADAEACEEIVVICPDPCSDQGWSSPVLKDRLLRAAGLAPFPAEAGSFSRNGPV